MTDKDRAEIDKATSFWGWVVVATLGIIFACLFSGAGHAGIAMALVLNAEVQMWKHDTTKQ